MESSSIVIQEIIHSLSKGSVGGPTLPFPFQPVRHNGETCDSHASAILYHLPRVIKQKFDVLLPQTVAFPFPPSFCFGPKFVFPSPPNGAGMSVCVLVAIFSSPAAQNYINVIGPKFFQGSNVGFAHMAMDFQSMMPVHSHHNVWPFGVNNDGAILFFLEACPRWGCAAAAALL